MLDTVSGNKERTLNKATQDFYLHEAYILMDDTTNTILKKNGNGYPFTSVKVLFMLYQ